VSIGSTCWIVFYHLTHGGEISSVLLLLYWSLNLPVLGQSLMTTIQQYPATRNHLVRLLEPLGAPEEILTDTESVPASSNLNSPPPSPHVVSPSKIGVAIALQNVNVVAAGRAILSGMNLVIEPGEHVAIIGPSGAGKSSLVGLLLGWQQPASGNLRIDGHTYSGPIVAALRQETAWVDPSVQLWNRSLTANLIYGLGRKAPPPLDHVLAMADLYDVLSTLPDGLATVLGEGGGFVSGGEGQRVRLGRALLKPKVRLALLDEPFRGLDRDHRRRLLATARQHWQSATLLCVTHDIAETLDFPRVLVIEDGQIVEDGSPQSLMADVESRYSALNAANAAMNQEIWGSEQWRRIQVEAGRVQEL
jgi:ABC-type transport system involved in cytochrome bd biosynthesis fused ATPase/permease subunit